MIVAVIPARGGSKRIPGKNIRSFCGQPIIRYSVDAARESGVFDRIVVSTDDDRIAEVAQECGAEVPFRRPAELSDDFTTTIPVIRHAVNTLSTPEDPVESACCIYATAPFVTSSDIRAGFEKLQEHEGADFVLPVASYSFPIFRSVQLHGDAIEVFFPEHEQTRSQDLPQAWHDAGQFYWGTLSAWRGDRGFFSAASFGIPIPRYRVQDIDDEEDWVRAELIYQALQKEQAGS